MGQGAPRVAGALVCLVVVLAEPAGSHASRLGVVLGGPPVTVLAGRLQIGPPWTWLLLGLLFVVASVPLVQLDAAAISLTLVRGVSRRRWAAARLAAVAAGACAFLTLAVAVAAVTVFIGWRSGPLLTSRGAGDIGLWALGLTGLGWWQLALGILCDTPWPGFTAAVLLLGVSAFGSSLAPFVPVAQTIVALHGLPGTLSWAGGAWFLAGWTAVGAIAVLTCAPGRLGYR
jgi:hypothetical protein